MSGIRITTLDQQTAAEARVIDPVLSSVARGYKFEEFTFPHLFPIVPVGQRGGTIITFGTEEFRKRQTERAPGARIERLQFGYTGDTYALVQRALAGQVPVEHLEESAAEPGISRGMMAARKTMAAVGLQIELEAAELATTAANYPTDNTVKLAGDAKWSSDASNPLVAVEEAKEQVAQGIGMEPNVLILGTKAWRALRTHDIIRKEIYNTRAAAMVTTEHLAAILDVPKVMVARTRYQDAAGGDFVTAWGNNAVLAYADVSSLAEMGSPSFGYTYRLNGYPQSRMPYFDNEVNSWVYPIYCEDQPVIAGKVAGYLWRSVG